MALISVSISSLVSNATFETINHDIPKETYTIAQNFSFDKVVDMSKSTGSFYLNGATVTVSVTNDNTVLVYVSPSHSNSIIQITLIDSVGNYYSSNGNNYLYYVPTPNAAYCYIIVSVDGQTGNITINF